MLLLECLQCTVGQEASPPSPALIPIILLSLMSWIPSDCQVKKWGWEDDTDLHLALLGLSFSGCKKFLILSWENWLILFSSCRGPWNTCSSLHRDWGLLFPCHVPSLDTQPKCPGWAYCFCGPTSASHRGLWYSWACCMFNTKRNTLPQRRLWRKWFNVGALNHPLQRTVDPVSPWPTQNSGSPAWARLFGA